MWARVPLLLLPVVVLLILYAAFVDTSVSFLAGNSLWWLNQMAEGFGRLPAAAAQRPDGRLRTARDGGPWLLPDPDPDPDPL